MKFLNYLSVFQVFRHGLAGDSTNRWFDKSLTMIFFKNGLVASNCDVSFQHAMFSSDLLNS